jgi:hypothetical protein
MHYIMLTVSLLSHSQTFKSLLFKSSLQESYPYLSIVRVKLPTLQDSNFDYNREGYRVGEQVGFGIHDNRSSLPEE